jgi:hypothetical protein
LFLTWSSMAMPWDDYLEDSFLWVRWGLMNQLVLPHHRWSSLEIREPLSLHLCPPIYIQLNMQQRWAFSLCSFPDHTLFFL